MDIIAYKEGEQEIRTGVGSDELEALLACDDVVVWVDIDVRNAEQYKVAEKVLRDIFGFHHLTIEDCREERNQPKAEEFPDYLFFIVHGIKPQARKTDFLTRELDGYLGKNFVVTYRNDDSRSIEAVREQLGRTPRAFQKGAAYLLHQVLDRMVDFYMPIMDDFDSAITELEDRVYETDARGGHEILEEIMDLRRAVARLKRISTRQREVLHRISHGEFPQIPENILPFYRDVHDHLVRVTDLAESYRDLVSGLFEIHFSVTASKTNDVMKFLALISATMLPLTLLAGIYGMNFENMPLLHSQYGYVVTVGIMLVVFVVLIVYFWRKGWFGR